MLTFLLSGILLFAVPINNNQPMDAVRLYIGVVSDNIAPDTIITEDNIFVLICEDGIHYMAQEPE